MDDGSITLLVALIVLIRVFRILLRLRDRIFFPEPDTPEKPR